MTGKLNLIFLVVMILHAAGCAAAPVGDGTAPAKPGDPSVQKPEIIEVFACGDYCPGPRERYLVKAYKGVSTREECLRLGGRPYEYVGWGKHFVCIAD